MKPNIIYLLSDQHNHRVMGNSGDSYARTPNLDSLYARGNGFGFMLLRRAFVCAQQVVHADRPSAHQERGL